MTLEIKTTFDVLHECAENVRKRLPSIYTSEYENKKWVSVQSIADRIETICNHGNKRDMRFRNLLLMELNALTPDSEPDGSTHNKD